MLTGQRTETEPQPPSENVRAKRQKGLWDDLPAAWPVIVLLLFLNMPFSGLKAKSPKDTVFPPLLMWAEREARLTPGRDDGPASPQRSPQQPTGQQWA